MHLLWHDNPVATPLHIMIQVISKDHHPMGRNTIMMVEVHEALKTGKIIFADQGLWITAQAVK
jgi:hypothetical protein